MMKLKCKILLKFFGSLFLVFSICMNGNSQSIQQNNIFKRAKENFDFSWQFYKGDIAMKRVVKAGGQGGLTDINVKIITKEDTTIDYSNVESAKIFFPHDWKEVNLPHDWVVEGTFVHNNNLGSQPAGSGYLPLG